ncbi:MAG TPA: M20/M25/M40 family metallo-hydrolase [Gemmataceae bacterium]|nr:M20/M25/M40 family metallo-hydrolase [Gemmataceae bacterium]
MPVAALTFNEEHALSRLLRFLAVEGVTGQEKEIGEAVMRDLVESGVPRPAIVFDQANERIELSTEIGNLIVKLPGTRPGPRLLFMTHLDTVPLCAGAEPAQKGNRVISISEDRTALGGDNRTGVAVLATLAATLLEFQPPHPPLTLLFTVREESGLWGARNVSLDDLGHPVMGFNVDGQAADEFTVGAVGAERWEVEIEGRAAHAGVHPEEGISATMIAALALADVYRGGWFGKIKKSGKVGTSNVGSFGGIDGLSAGEATNVVTDYVHIKGESRSHNSRFVKVITRAYREAFLKAKEKVTDHKGRKARLEFRARQDYFPFRLSANSPVVKHAVAAAKEAGFTPRLRIGNGGLDANWLVRHGVPTVTFGAGQHNIHTIDEYVELAEFYQGCAMAIALATYTP